LSRPPLAAGLEPIDHGTRIVVKLLDSLLDAIVRLEGDALVMHVGEKPYVITTSAAMNAYRGPLAWGQVELSSRVLTFDAVSSMLAQILPVDQQRALDEMGAIEHEILPPDGILDRFTVVAARGGEDVWVEVRRKPTPPAVADVPEPVEAEPQAAVADEPVVAQAALAAEAAAVPVAASPAVAAEAPAAEAIVEPGQPDAASLQSSAAAEQDAPSDESIVVALPGEDYEEVQLDQVSENAIQIVDDEPQGVPTEEEVDAMLAATAGALLNSGLTVDADTMLDDSAQIQPAGSVELAPVEETTIDLSELDVAPAPFAAPAQESAPPQESAPVHQEEAAASPEFALSPPPAIIPEETAPELVEARIDVVEGTPLFSDEAIAAAAAPEPEVAPEPQAVPEPAAIEPARPESATIELAVIEHAALELSAIEPVALEAEPPAPAAPEPAAAPELEPVQTAPPEAVVPDVPVPVDVAPVLDDQPVIATAEDLDAQAAVWSEALAEWANEPAQAAMLSPESITTDSSFAVHAAAMESTPPPSDAPAAHIPEMPMDATHEPRHEDARAPHHATAAPTETYEPAHAQSDHDAARHSVVVPIRPEPIAAPYTPAEDAALTRTLRQAAGRGAATVYVVAQSKPMIRVDGEILPLESEPVLTAADVDRLVLELAPPRRREALQTGPVEWLCDIPEIGRVRCLTFRDHRGPGVLFRMFPPRAISADQLGLTPEVQALCQQSDGLVLVAGARASGKSTLLNAFVDLINRTRSDHVITIESQIGFVHESRKSFISQRETRGDADLAASVARAALREDPDVMMIEELRSAELVSAALEAAESGRLVLASVPAVSTIAALERVIELLPAERRARGRASLATSLRGVLAQALLRRVTGGRVAAREILHNTPAVSTLVLEGKMFQLPVALDSGRRHGMIPLTDSLALHVREGTVHAGEAYRKALDRAALVAALKRDGVDTSFADRLA
jgi:twitching motility protein PilT